MDQVIEKMFDMFVVANLHKPIIFIIINMKILIKFNKILNEYLNFDLNTYFHNCNHQLKHQF